MDLTVEVGYCGALRLTGLPGASQQLHGHDYRLAITLSGRPDPKTGAIVDFLEVKAAAEELVVRALDHKLINEVIDNPTAERQVTWIWSRLKPRLPQLGELRLWESPAFSVTYRGE